MGQPAPDLLGRLAVHYKLITMQQLSAATQEQARAPHKKLGAIMVELGLIDKNQLAQLLEAQRQYLAQQAKQAGSVLKQAGRPAPPPPRRPERPAPPQPPIDPASHGGEPDREETEPNEPSDRPPPRKRVELPRDPARIKWLHKVLTRACELNASDVLLHARAPITLRVYGSLVNLAKEALHPRDSEAVLLPLMNEWQRDIYFEEGQVDFSYEVPQVARFRVNVYNDYTGCCGVFHYIPARPPTLAELGLPNALARVINHQNGIVLITGPAGSGKTSTMAALVNLINEERSDHILSIEDPIEYVHTSRGCIVNQRQVNRHTRSFAGALRSALREDPDVICIGELRDLETISLALSAAETGHLVLGTLHTLGAIRTVNRIVGAFPPSQQPQVRTMLSESLRAIISQTLVRRRDRSGMALAYELLLVNHATANLIRENRTFQISSVLQTGRARGMRSRDDSLSELVHRGDIDRETAALHAEDPRHFR